MKTGGKRGLCQWGTGGMWPTRQSRIQEKSLTSAGRHQPLGRGKSKPHSGSSRPTGRGRSSCRLMALNNQQVGLRYDQGFIPQYKPQNLTQASRRTGGGRGGGGHNSCDRCLGGGLFSVTSSPVTPEARRLCSDIRQMLKHQHTVCKFVWF